MQGGAKTTQYAVHRGKLYPVTALWAAARRYRARELPLSRFAADLAALKRHPSLTRKHLGADLRYPIILAPDGELLDGQGRLSRAAREGRATIKAVRLARLPRGYTEAEVLERARKAVGRGR